jgi:hypothetical protein
VDAASADRAAADEIVARHPTAKLSVWENRWFLHRAVRFMAGQGVRQFLDIGTGIPTSPNTHEIAQRPTRPPVSSMSTTIRWCWCTPGRC